MGLDVAVILGVTIEAVKSRLLRGRDTLRATLKN
jgi:DNA-directed RNA polymerase specialized sigma24 family protein